MLRFKLRRTNRTNVVNWYNRLYTPTHRVQRLCTLPINSTWLATCRNNFLTATPSLNMSRRRGGLDRDSTSVDLNDDQVQELRAAFNLFSGGKDHIDAAELKRVLGKFNIRDARPEDMIKDADPTGTGKVDFLQFSQMMAKRMAKTDTEEDLVKAFQKFDWRRGGSIKTEELAEALTNMGKPLTQRELQDLLAVCEKDGAVHYMKFVQEMFGAKEENAKQ